VLRQRDVMIDRHTIKMRSFALVNGGTRAADDGAVTGHNQRFGQACRLVNVGRCSMSAELFACNSIPGA
jgi:hypothetical protein